MNLFEASPARLSDYLHARRNAICTMCGAIMTDGFCTDAACATYPKPFGFPFVLLLKRAVETTHKAFIKRASKTKPSKVVSGGRVESKRRKH